MTQKSIKLFVNEIQSNGAKLNYATNKTDVCLIDGVFTFWSQDILDIEDYGPEIKEVINTFYLSKTISANLVGQQQ